jgi:hypothetical protein
MNTYKDNTGIWLEVVKARREGNMVSVQLKGDRQDHEPIWWPVQDTIAAHEAVAQVIKELDGAPAIDPKKNEQEIKEKIKAAESKAADVIRMLFDALDKNRLVTAKLIITIEDNHPSYLSCREIRIQSAESLR